MDIVLIKKIKNTKGFTIAELVVAAGIIAMISVLVIANFRGSSQKAALDNEAERLSTILRQANINSLIGLTTSSGSRPPGGYGLHLSTCQANCSYLLFADGLGADHIYNSNDTNDILVQTFGMLDDDVYINQVAITPTGGTPPSSLDIAFVPPQGLVYINGSNTATGAQITIGFKNTNYTKTITLDVKSGRINIQ
ncbi:hypothetical protein GYA54_02695 [Candidatus Kuenenbacteria bacterium]|nr:hypothetical protein [Candidatus Kuenenbacteria bacterium]